jgi:copper chaperone CopZ
MSPDELRWCEAELAECRDELEGEKERLSRCLNLYYSKLDVLVEALKELPASIHSFLEDKYGRVGISDADIMDAIEGILDSYGVDLKGDLKPGKHPKRIRKRERETRKAVLSADEERELSYCRNELAECLDELEGTRREADDCEQEIEYKDDLAEEILEDLPDLLAEEIVEMINEASYINDYLFDASGDEDEISRFIAEALEEHYSRKLKQY